MLQETHHENRKQGDRWAREGAGPGQLPFFLDFLSPLVPRDRQVLLGGDFNCGGTDLLEFTRNAWGRRCTGYIGGLQMVEETFGLIDACRELHPSDVSITHTCFSHSSGARLDKWLTSPALRQMLTDSRKVEGLPGDHQVVALRIMAVWGCRRWGG